MPSSRKKLRSRCPVGFEAVNIDDSRECPVLEDVLSDNDKSSLWLIKVPYDFDVSSLSGRNIVLNGSQDLLPSGAQNTGKRYEVQSRTDCGAELSSFTVLLPSVEKKSFCAAGSVSGQMSVIQSVSVPPATLPESSLSVQRQSPSQVIKRWKPFGYRNPRRKINHVAEEMSNNLSEEIEDPKDRPRKRTVERQMGNLEESRNSNASGLIKRDSQKKKKKDKEKYEVDLTRVKTEPDTNASSESAASYGEESSHSSRKRKAEMNKNEQIEEDIALTTSKKKKKLKSISLDMIVKQDPAMPSENSPRHSGRRQKDEADLGESSSLKQKKSISEKEFDLARVKTEPKESHKKKKHSKTKTC